MTLNYITENSRQLAGAQNRISQHTVIEFSKNFANPQNPAKIRPKKSAAHRAQRHKLHYFSSGAAGSSGTLELGLFILAISRLPIERN